MFAILYVPTNTVLDVCATEQAARRFLAEHLGLSHTVAVQRLTLEDALAHLRRFDASAHDATAV